MRKYFIAIALFLLSLGQADAQLASYIGSGGTSTAVTGVANETVSSLQWSGFGTNTPCGSGGKSGITVSTAWSAYSTAGPRVYIQILPNVGYQLDVTGISAGLRRSGTGPTCVRFAYSLDNGTTWTDDGACHAPNNGGCATNAARSWAGGTLPTCITNTTDGIIVAIFPYLPGGSTGTFQVNNFIVSGSVNPVCALPGPITGSTSLCTGQTSTLSNSTAGGTWTSSSSAATIGASTGIVTGVSAGTAVITYATGSCCFATTTVTISSGPTAITGPTAVCTGASISLSSTPSGGTWSSSSSSATVDAATGVVFGVSAGTSVISYTLSTGCFVSSTVTVDPSPSVIMGSLALCSGTATTLSNALAGGTWSSSNLAVATINPASGVLSGVSGGTSTITYMMGTGCFAATIATVYATPPNISGPTTVCEGATITLSNSLAGGTWSSSSTANATIGGTTGILSGITAGTTVITYALSTGCSIATTITIDPVPAAITGTASLCASATTSLTTTSTGGTWASSAATATVGAATGVVSGVSAGTTIISYSFSTGCAVTRVVTVYPLPSVITGFSTVCTGATITLSNTTTGGTWSSSNGNATIGATTGIVTGVAPGNSVITYQLVTGCFVTTTITINPSPAAIAGTLGVCVGLTTTLSNASAGGSWFSSTGVATVGTGSGIVTGVSAGTSVISYRLSTGCFTIAVTTVHPLPGAITGPSAVCQGSTITLANSAAGGTWSSGSARATAGVSSGVVYGVSPGVGSITYTLPTGCIATRAVTVNLSPLPISGTLSVCIGLTTSLSNGTGGGAWSSSSTVVASVGAATGIVRGISAGSAIISYSLVSSCATTATVLVNPLPGPITGLSTVCTGSSITLTNTVGGGTWFSTATTVAVGATTGVVTGLSAGTASITYTSGSGCFVSTVITVYPTPGAIAGPTDVCEGAMVTLSHATAGGSWSSTSTIATVDASSGIVSGITPGLAVVTYQLPTGCYATTAINVHPMPSAIGGTLNVCVGNTTALTNALSGGNWTSSTANATIDIATGVATGVTAGFATITYAIPTGCEVTAVLLVNPLPAAITGTFVVCPGSSSLLSNVDLGGSWTSSNMTIATINPSTGLYTGTSSGAATITYTLPTGCAAIAGVSVLPLPTGYSVTGGGTICAGAAGLPIGLSFSDAGMSYQLYSGSTAIGSPLIGSSSSLAFGVFTTAGVYTIEATDMATGCTNWMTGAATIVVNPLPARYTITGGGYFCIGDTGVHIGLAGSDLGIRYKLYNGATFTGTVLPGTGVALDFGLHTTTGIYSIEAVDNTTGCSNGMTGSTRVTMLISVVPTVTINAGGAEDSVCMGAVITYSALATYEGSVPSYTWKLNGAPTGVTGSTYSLRPANGDVVQVVLRSSLSCALPDTATANDTVAVTPSYLPFLRVTPSPSNIVCAGRPVVYNLLPGFGGSAPTFKWFKNGVMQATGSVYSYLPADGDRIHCVMNSTLRCRQNDTALSNSVLMMVTTPVVTIYASYGLTLVAGQVLKLVAMHTGLGTSASYQWLKNGVPVTGAISQVYTSTDFADGDVMTCMVTGDGVCNDPVTGSATVRVRNVVGVATVGEGNRVHVYPNPNQGSFSVSGTVAATDGDAVLELTNMLGQVVYHHGITIQNGEIKEQTFTAYNLANGMYLLSIRAASGVFVCQVMVER